MEQKKFDKEINLIMDQFDKLLVQADANQSGRLINLGKEITRAATGHLSRHIFGKKETK